MISAGNEETGPALRVGVILDRQRRPEPWQLRLLERIRASPRLELCALMQPAERGSRAVGHGPLRAWFALERKLAARPMPDPATLAVLEPLGAGAVDDEATIAQLALDVILDLTGNAGALCRSDLARHGVWFLDFLTDEPAVAGLRAILAAEPISRIALCRRRAQGQAPVTIATGNLNTKFLAARNALFMCEKAVSLVIRELERTQRLGRPGEAPGEAFAVPEWPGPSAIAHYFAQVASEGAARLRTKILSRLGFRPGMFFLKTAPGDFLDFDPATALAHPPAGNVYHADPFLWEHDGRRYCFFETYDYAAKKGHISVGRFERDELVGIETALRADYHLSFPFLFEVDDALYMMPETCGARRLELWRCREFPCRWERHATLLDNVVASDSTLARIDGELWLFTNVSTDPFGDMNTELHVYRVEEPGLGHLVPHRANPVVFDSRTARNAGRILKRDGAYYRPSQDNSHGVYGHGLNIMRIDRLSPEDYAETLVRRIEPDFESGIIGCHHLDSRSGMIVMDVCRGLGGR